MGLRHWACAALENSNPTHSFYALESAWERRWFTWGSDKVSDTVGTRALVSGMTVNPHIICLRCKEPPIARLSFPGPVCKLQI